MNIYGLDYQNKKSFNTNKIMKIKRLHNISINDRINTPFQYYNNQSIKHNINIYTDYNYNNEKINYDGFNYFINVNNETSKNKTYSSLTQTIKNTNIKNGNIKINEINKNKSYSNKTLNNNNKFIINDFIGNNNTFIYDDDYYKLYTHKKLNTSPFPNFNTRLNPIDYYTNNYYDFNSNSLDLDVIYNSNKRHVISNLNNDWKKSIEFNGNNEYKDYFKQLDGQPIDEIKSKKDKFMKINILNGRLYIPQKNENSKNNNMIYISDQNKSIETDFHNPYKNKINENQRIKNIHLNNSYKEINNEKQLFKIKSINYKIKKKISQGLKKINKIPKILHISNYNLDSFSLVDKTNNQNINVNSKLLNKNKNIIEEKKENNNIQVNNKNLNQILKKVIKVPKIKRKKINLNLFKKNLTTNEELRHNNKKQNPLMKYNSINNKKIQKNNFNRIRSNNSNIPFSNNVLFVSININEEEKVEQTKNKDDNLGFNYRLNKVENYKKFKLGNQFKTKKECELCHELIFCYIYKTHYMSHPAKILDFLFLGNFIHATNISDLKKLKINYILNVAKECYNYKLPKDLKETHWMIKDEEDFDIIDYFEEANEFIDKCKLMGGTCLVHCKMGVSRSATIVIAYLIKIKNLSVDEAFDFVKKKRISINPNPGFMKQLYEYEKIIRNKECKYK